MDPHVRTWLFEGAISSPGVWLVQAHQLREAARLLDWVHRNFETGENLGFLVEYRLLFALSVENLLKGIIIAHRLRAGTTDPLRGVLSHHKLHVLAAEVPSAEFHFSQDELNVLAELTPYIEWAGRYPFPKKAEGYVSRGHSSKEHDDEVALWQRMFSHLKQVGWVSKGKPDDSGWFFLLTR